MNGVLADIGYADALLARRTEAGLQLIDGHLRASLDPAQMVPVLVLDLDEIEAGKLLLTLDPLAGMAQPDSDALMALLQEARFEDSAVNAMLEALANGERFPMPDFANVAQPSQETIDQVEANDYNPNIVAKNELRLLYHSIKADGYTQPVVTVYDAERDKYVIVDGFHRYLVMVYHADIREPRGGLLPIVVIDKPINDRMASTIRHNRARGKHNIAGMAGIVFKMLEGGWDDAAICSELGMEADELIRLQYVTGFAKLFENVEYRQSWETRRMIKLRRDYVNPAEAR